MLSTKTNYNWTTGTIRNCRKLYEDEGLTFLAISRLVGPPISTIRYWVASYGWVRKVPTKDPRNINHEIREKVLEAYDPSVSLRKQTNTFGVSRETLRTWLKEANCPKKEMETA